MGEVHTYVGTYSVLRTGHLIDQPFRHLLEIVVSELSGVRLAEAAGRPPILLLRPVGLDWEVGTRDSGLGLGADSSSSGCIGGRHDDESSELVGVSFAPRSEAGLEDSPAGPRARGSL